MEVLKYAFVIIFSYLCGSFSTSIFISKLLYGIDVRNYGSGNAGASNTLRTLGAKKAVVVLLGDVLKVVVPILVAKWVGIKYPVIIAGTFAVIGHAKPIFYGFKGGKGVACSLAILLMFDWKMTFPVLIMFAIGFLSTKMISIGTFCAIITAWIYIFINYGSDPLLLVYFTCLAAYLFWLHRSNIKRLINGTESKIDFKAKLLKDVEKK
ncbi:MAG: glycerol-3-phosphate 1-O-acyltransferase PlsY [Clostridia bacterium]|nr:glycerol-3-phosphate 1-O-acyltransferase PlsY [Clostridia bacterium]MBQ7087388.1 glycerol-3-phosphate 1-O-acyltransferase PlsY [Clostridia bacterium]